MPVLTEERKLQREAQVARVMGMMFLDPEMTREEACEEVGISTDIFRRWVHSGQGMIKALRGYLEDLQRDMLFDITRSQKQIVELIIKDAIDPLTDSTDRVKLNEHLISLSDRLQRVYHAIPGIEEEASHFLTQGPSTHKQKSRLASIEVERTDGGVTVHIEENPDIIDITPED